MDKLNDRYDLRVVAKTINQLRESFNSEGSMATLRVLIELYQYVSEETSLIVSDLIELRRQNDFRRMEK